MLQKLMGRSWRAASLALQLLFSMTAMAAAASTAATAQRLNPASGSRALQQLSMEKVSAATPQPSAQPTRTAPPLSLTLTMIVTCCSVGLVVGVIVLGFIVAISNRKSQGEAGPSSTPPS